MASLQTYLHEMISALQAEEKQLKKQAETGTGHSGLIQQLTSLAGRLDRSRYRILRGVLAKKKMSRFRFRRIKDDRFNTLQLKAINGCRRHRIAIVWSPPGEGKTGTLAHIMAQSAQAGKDVLFLARSPEAVDEGIMHICQILHHHPFYAGGKIIRFGDCHREMIQRKYSRVLPDKYLPLKFKKLDQQIRSLTIQIGVLQEKINRILTINRDLKQLKQENQNLRAYKSEVEKSAPDDDLRGIKENAIRSQERKIQHLAEKINSMIKSLHISRRKITRFKEKFENKKRELTSRKENLAGKREKQEREYYLQANIFCATLNDAVSTDHFPRRSFDLLLMDEAEMTSMPYVFWTLTRCTDSAVFAGDYLQGSPACVSRQANVQKWLGRSIFDYMGLDSVSRRQDSPILFPLKPL